MHIIKELEVYKNLLNDSDIVSITDNRGIITYVNDMFCTVSGYSKEELIGKNHNIIRHPYESAKLFNELWETISSGNVFKSIIRNKKKNGDEYYVDSTIHPIFDNEGNIESYIAIRHEVTDIIDKKVVIEKDLKNFLNPILFLFSIELNETNFYLYEEKNALQFYSKIIEQIVLYFDLFERFSFVQLGSNKFILIIESSSIIDVKNLEDSILSFLQIIYESHHRVEDSLVNFFIDFFYSQNAENSLSDVFTASFIKHNKHNVSNINQLIQNSNAQFKNILKETKKAIVEDNILCYFQPILNNRTLKIEKFEALVRLFDSNGKIIPPSEFLYAIKDTFAYFNMTKKVIINSVKFSAENNIPVSINISLNDIKHQFVRDLIIQEITKSFSPELIIVEILEDKDTSVTYEILSFLNHLRSLGVSIAIDDFGVGYSNYERILSINPDIVKIDGSLIKKINSDEMAKNIVQFICLFCIQNNIKTVAEYVEDYEILNFVTNIGIDFSQGYHIGKPSTSDIAASLI